MYEQIEVGINWAEKLLPSFSKEPGGATVAEKILMFELSYSERKAFAPASFWELL